MDKRPFSILSSLLIVVALVAGWPETTVGGQHAAPLDVSERFLSWSVEGNQEYEILGASLGTAGDVNGDGFDDLIVGAPGFNNIGRAYLFLGSPGGLATSPAWHVDGVAPFFTGFALQLAAAGDVNGDGYDDVLVGPLVVDNQPFANLYLGSSEGLSSTPSRSIPGEVTAGAGDVNGDGYDDILIGRESFANGQQSEGVAWVFYGSPTGPGANPDWFVEGNQAHALLGRAVSSAGDVNDDGYDDIIVAAPRYTDAFSNEGAVYVFLGGPSGLQTTPVWTRLGGQDFVQLGEHVGTAGDANGDGYDEVVVWSQNYYAYLSSVEVFFGSPTGPAANASWAQGSSSGYGFGYSLGAAGDVNRDGYDDLVIGAPTLGRAFVYYGSTSGPSRAAQWILGAKVPSTGLGGAVGTAGDVNGDGYDDLAVGVSEHSGEQRREGQARVYHGSYHGLSGTIAAYVFAAPPTIDGNLGDWGALTPLVLDSDTAETVQLRGAQTMPPVPSDSSANLRAGWDADFIYLAVHVVDDTIVNDSDDVWRDDEVELAFDGEHNGWYGDQFDHQYTVNADGRLTDSATMVSPPGVIAATQTVPGGWTVEVRVARSALSTTLLQPGKTMGFSLGLHDDDDREDWDSYLIWASDDTSTGTGGFATLRLTASGAPPPGPSTSTPTATLTSTRTPTATRTATPTPTSTPTPTPTSTPTPTATYTPTPPPTTTPSGTAPPTTTPTPRVTSTSTATRIPARYLPLILHRGP